MKKIQLVIIILIIITFIIVIGLSLWLNARQQSVGEDIPKQLDNLELINIVRGKEALAQINNMHGLVIELKNGFIVEYADTSPYQGNEHVTIWVGRVENDGAAALLTQRMVESIRDGGSPFNNLRQMTVNGYEFFQVDGPGGMHFFYHSVKMTDSVVWISLETDDFFPILEQITKTF